MFPVKLEGLTASVVVPVGLVRITRRAQTDKTGSLTPYTWTISLPQVSASVRANHDVIPDRQISKHSLYSLVMKPNHYETGCIFISCCFFYCTRSNDLMVKFIMLSEDITRRGT
jgi:hypothetical protein